MRLVSKVFLVGKVLLFFIAFSIFLSTFSSHPVSAQTPGDSNCDPGGSILGFPTWWEYMEIDEGADGQCRPSINETKDLLPIGIALLEIMLRLAGILAVTFIIVGGFKYMISQGEPDKAKSAKGTIINAIIGLVIAIIAAAIVSFIGNNIGAS